MDKSNSDDLDEIDDLLEMEEFDELENPNSNQDNGYDGSEITDNHILCLENLKTTMKTINVPMILLNKHMEIGWENPAFRILSQKLPVKGHQTLHSIFDSAEAVSLNKALISNQYGMSDPIWKNHLGAYGLSSDSFIANALHIPIVDNASDNKSVDQMLCVIDDITLEYKTLLRNVFLSLLGASKLKDNDTGNHIERVNRYSFLMSKRLLYKKDYPEVDELFVENIGFLAAMHDVGKIGTPDDILNKKGPLEIWEMDIMKEHTKNGAFILATYPNPMAKEIAIGHHEKWDGSGYPYGLFETMIPLSARIVTIADVYDALRSKRSYKEPYSHKKALSIMNSQKGSHFDPTLFDIFIHHHKVFEKAYDELKDS